MLHQELVVSLETVTPVFLGGADVRGKPELRLSSFRGVLRYWMRVALGGIHGGDWKAVQDEESKIFGSAHDEKLAQASPVSLRITPYSQGRELSYRNMVGSGKDRLAGLAYLFFMARETRQEQEKSALTGSFILTCSLRPGVRDGQNILRKIYVALWFLTRFGGIGNRSRRGAGALQVVSFNAPKIVLEALPLLPVNASTPKELATELEAGLRTLRKGLGLNEFPKLEEAVAFDILHPEACKVWVLDRQYETWQQVLNEIGQAFQAFRSRRQPDYETIKDSLQYQKNLSQPVDRAAFGLPIPFYYRSLNGIKATLEPETHDRRASPLWFRPVKLAGGKFTAVFLHFRSRFLPVKERLKLRCGQQAFFGDIPNPDLLEIFLLGPDPVKHSSLRDRGFRLREVNYA